MRRLMVVLSMILSAGQAAAYQEHVAFGEEPMLSVIVEPDAVFDGGGYVQGEIVVTVRVSSLHPFEALDVDMPVIDGASLVTLLKPRMREVRSYAGKGYVLERIVAIYPEASGTLVIPPIRATGRVEPEPDKPLDFVEESPPIPVEIAGIHPGFRGEWWMVSRNVIMSETWSKPVEEIREGDVFRREVMITAQGVPHTRIVMPEHGRTRGIEISDAGEWGRTENTTDGVIGTLVHAWDLKMTGTRTLYISPMGVDYWHPDERAPGKAAVRGYRIEPLPADEAQAAAALMMEARERHDGQRMIAAGATALVAAPLVLLVIAWLWQFVPTAADRTLKASCRAGARPADVYRAARAWAVESGIELAAVARPRAPAFSALQDRLFGGGTVEVAPGRVARELLALSRRRRRAALGESFERIISRLIGRKNRLAARRRGPAAPLF